MNRLPVATSRNRAVTYCPIGEPSGLVRQIHATTRAADRSAAVADLSRCLTDALSEHQAPINDS